MKRDRPALRADDAASRTADLHRAEDLARELGVSVRTIYRDMDTLAASGVPVEGARGHRLHRPRRDHPAAAEPHRSGTRGAASRPRRGRRRRDGRAGRGRARTLSRQDRRGPATGYRHGARAASASPPIPSPRPRRGFATCPRSARRSAPGRSYASRSRASDRPRVVRPLHIDYWGRVWTCVVWDEDDGRFRDASASTGSRALRPLARPLRRRAGQAAVGLRP